MKGASPAWHTIQHVVCLLADNFADCEGSWSAADGVGRLARHYQCQYQTVVHCLN